MIKPLKIILTILIVVGLTAGGWYIKQHHSKLNTAAADEQNTTGTDQASAPSLNGTLASPETSKQRPIAIMVENHPDSRPQSGLSQADIVYEVVAEGGITRFLTIYQTADKAVMGPVRSARVYYAELAQQYKPLFAHVGGSDDALANLKNGDYAGLDDINEFYQGQYFDRVKTRQAPHNTYANLEDLRGYLDDKHLETTNGIEPLWEFKNDATHSDNLSSAETISINFSRADFKVKYTYNKDTNLYTRLIAGTPDIDSAAKKPITPKNILVQLVPIDPIPNDPKLRVDVNLQGTGQLFAFLDGKVTKGTWKKNGTEPIKYFDDNNNPLALNRGQTWISLVANDEERVTWNTTLNPTP